MKSVSDIGGLLLDSGKITSADVERILRVQKEKGLNFGDAGKALGLLSDEDVQQALSQQFHYSYLSKTNENFCPELIAAYQPFSEQVEVFRGIRSQLMMRWFNKNRKALAIISPANGYGRSFLAANLAIVFSQLGECTLLIDGDMHQPRQNQLFNISEKCGLSDLLAGHVDTSVITKIPAFLDLSILGAGTIPPNPSELIGRRLDAVLQQLASEYDVILLDTPSGLQISDAQLLAAKAGGALLIARQNQTSLASLEAIKNLLEDAGTVCVGAVINDF
jgi:protein-tyrosine kinase